MRKGLSDFLSIVLVLAVSSGYAALLGFVNTDSWYYLQLAHSLRMGEGCSLGGQYFAVFPCGYSAVLALLSPGDSFVALILASKVVNALLLLSAFACLRAFVGVNWIAAFIVIAPATLYISAYTWSENLFLAASCLTLLLIKRLAQSPGIARAALLALALLLGVCSRYFFAPYAFLLWLGVLVLYGRRTALWALPAFAIAAIAYAAYSLFNVHLTGYATGIERQPSLETLTFIVSHFFWKIGTLDLFCTLAVLATLVAIAWRSLQWQSPRDALRSATREMLFLVWAGAAFLVLALFLRIQAQYDLFGTRTIGQGLVFLVAGVAGLLLRVVPDRRFTQAATLAAGLLALVIAQWQSLPVAIDLIAAGNYRSVPKLLHEYTTRFKDKQLDAIVIFSIPGPSRFIMFNAGMYYGSHARIINPQTQPGPGIETVESLTRKLAQYRPGECAVDFTPYETREQLASQLNATYDVDYSVSLEKGQPIRKKMRVYDQGFADYVLARFVPGAAVDCRVMFPS